MAYPRHALVLALLLTACPGGEQNDSGDGSSTGSTPTTMPTGADEGPCPEGGLPCDGACVYFGSDENNCGGCGNVCGAGLECIGAECVDTNPCDEAGGDGTPCGGSCVDIDNDPGNCGDCGNQCGENEECNGGMCIPVGDTNPPPPETTTGMDPTTSGDPSTSGDPTTGGGTGTTAATM